MRVLLDTHVFIWLDIAKDRLSEQAKHVILNTENTLYVSLVSLWEIQIKMQLGKLHLNAPLQDTWQSQQKTNGLHLMPIELAHILALSTLPSHHGDPFDRLLIAQTKTDELTILTNDDKIQQYEVSHLW